MEQDQKKDIQQAIDKALSKFLEQKDQCTEFVLLSKSEDQGVCCIAGTGKGIRFLLKRAMASEPAFKRIVDCALNHEHDKNSDFMEWLAGEILSALKRDEKADPAADPKPETAN